MNTLSALPVAIPFIAAPLLVATGSLRARWFHDSVGTLSAVAAATLCVLIVVHSWRQPYAYWIGNFMSVVDSCANSCHKSRRMTARSPADPRALTGVSAGQGRSGSEEMLGAPEGPDPRIRTVSTRCRRPARRDTSSR